MSVELLDYAGWILTWLVALQPLLGLRFALSGLQQRRSNQFVLPRPSSAYYTVVSHIVLLPPEFELLDFRFFLSLTWLPFGFALRGTHSVSEPTVLNEIRITIRPMFHVTTQKVLKTI